MQTTNKGEQQMVTITYPHSLKKGFAVWPTESITKIDWSKISVFSQKWQAQQRSRMLADTVVVPIVNGKLEIKKENFNLKVA